jgi:hypothetical protein
MRLFTQPGPDSEVAERPDDFRFLGYSGLVVLTASLSESDPNVWSGRALQEVSSIRQMRSCINVSGL